jgi:phosphatidylserine synthase
MKKDLIFTPVMIAIAILLGMYSVMGMPAHIAISVIGILVLAVYTSLTKKEWKIPALEIVMRAFYGIALITGAVVMNLEEVLALQIAHKASAVVFVVLLVVLFVHKLIVRKKAAK